MYQRHQRELFTAMTESTESKSNVEIKSDPGWKQRVKAEAADLDAKRDAERQERSSQPGPPDDATNRPAADTASRPPSNASQLPPADFQVLVTIFSTQAMIALGVLPSPVSGKIERDLMLARQFIDLLGVLQEKTKRNLTGHEADFLDQSLHDLRMAFVEVSQSETSTPP